MDAKFDSNIELPPNMILIMAGILLIAAFGIVGMITMADHMATPAAAPAQQ